MNNKQYIAELARKTGFSQEDTQRLVRKVIDAMITQFEEGEQVTIPDFGTFEVKKRLERVVVIRLRRSASWFLRNLCSDSDLLLPSRKK